MYGVTGDEVEPRLFGTHETDVVRRYSPECPLTPWGARLGESLGGTLARIHSSLDLVEVGSLSLATVPDVDWSAVNDALATHVGLPALRQLASDVAEWEANLPEPRRLVHGDPHFGNLMVDPDSGELTGLLDLDEAGMGRRGDDLKFLPSEGPRFVAAAQHGYELAGGLWPTTEEVHRFHLRTAFDHLTFIAPTHPRFPRIVAWLLDAMAHRSSG